MKQAVLKGKFLIEAVITLVTGLHIGTSSDFTPIGAVESPFVRDHFTKVPIIPGSSLKGKLRTLLAKMRSPGYVLNKIEDDDEVICRLFGSTSKNGVIGARLQFYDVFVTPESIEKISRMDTDTYMGEVKFENSITRLTATAIPRQIERVPAGTDFAFKLVYNIENEKEIEEDFATLSAALMMLQMDYLGGHGSRGYGRVAFSNFSVRYAGLNKNLEEYTGRLKTALEGSCLE